MTWVAAAIGGSALIGAAGSMAGASKQAGAAKDASAQQMAMFNTINAQQQPFIKTGYGANNALNYLMGLPGTGQGGSYTTDERKVGGSSFNHASSIAKLLKQGMSVDDILKIGTLNGKLNMGSIKALTDAGLSSEDIGRLQTGTFSSGGEGGAGGMDGAGSPIMGLDQGYLTHQFNQDDFFDNIDPSYEWRKQQGGQALQNSAAAGSGVLSGAALKDLIGYNSGMASTEYGNAFNRYTNQQNNIFSRLSGLANLGQNAAAGVGQQGTALAGQAGQATMAAGTAQGAGYVGAANAAAGGVGDYLGAKYYGLV